jgi:hypothetical protein
MLSGRRCGEFGFCAGSPKAWHAGKPFQEPRRKVAGAGDRREEHNGIFFQDAVRSLLRRYNLPSIHAAFSLLPTCFL